MDNKRYVQKSYDTAVNTALLEVERMARKLLAENPHLERFVMAMGTYFFVDKKGNNIDPLTSNGNTWDYSKKYFKPLVDFICEWDQYLKLTGYSMSFTAKGQKITDW